MSKLKPNQKPPKFNTFFMAGYECTYAKIEGNKRLDILLETKHEEYIHKDYDLIKDIGITTVREGLAWSQIDKGNNVYDFSRFELIMQTAKEEGIQQIWDLNHFDYPEYLDPFSDKFVKQFAEYSKHVITLIRKYQEGTIYIVPVNETSFFSWIAADIGKWAPYTIGRGKEFKIQLVKANIAAINSIREVDSDVGFIQVDPIMRRRAKKPSNPDSRANARDFNNRVRYEAWDMLTGKVSPELGGESKYLDIIGLNYYHNNQQWVKVLRNDEDKLVNLNMHWFSKYRIPFDRMIGDVYKRYKKPIVISETGSWGDTRYKWWKELLPQINNGLKNGLPIYGVCIYPIIDRRDWDYFHLTNSGLWDYADDDLSCQRIPHTKSIEIIKKYAGKWR